MAPMQLTQLLLLLLLQHADTHANAAGKVDQDL
jgi:hypothetical protein